jgi:hypothetical protein
MAHAPLISAEMFDYLRNQGIEPYTKLDDYVREQLGDGVRVVSLFAGERLSTRKPVQRVTVLSGTVRLDPSGVLLTLESTRDHAVLTEDSESQLVAETDTVLLLVDAGFLDTLSSWAELAAYARQTGGDELARRLLAVRHTVSFNQLPLEHVIQALQQMTPKTVKAGEAVVTQGDKGDAFYVIRSGRAEVWKAGIYDDEQKRVDTMGPGDSFGDEALVTGGTRNATVKMVEDGELLVLGAAAFRELMSQPLLAEVAPEAVPTLLDEWLEGGRRPLRRRIRGRPHPRRPAPAAPRIAPTGRRHARQNREIHHRLPERQAQFGRRLPAHPARLRRRQHEGRHVLVARRTDRLMAYEYAARWAARRTTPMKTAISPDRPAQPQGKHPYRGP